LKEIVAGGVIALLRACGAMGAARTLFGGQGIILTLHEVRDDPVPALSDAVSVQGLDWMLTWLRAEGWDLVSMDEANDRLRNGHPGSRRFAAVTCDDGYRDTLTHLLPVMMKHAAPLAVYVPTQSLTRELFCWWLGLRAVFLSNETVEIEGFEAAFDCATPEAKQASFDRVSHWVHQDYSRQPGLARTFERYGISLPALNEQYFMTEADLKGMSRNPLVTIGGHTVSHRALATLDREAAWREIADNRGWLQQLLDQPIDHFAYPYGNARACGAREAELAASAGYRTAVTTRQATVRARMANPHFLPRIRVPTAIESRAFDGRASGLYFAMHGSGATRRRAKLSG